MKIKGKTRTPTWRDEAVCLDYPSELFFPIGEIGASLNQTEQAKTVCARCPVLYQCLKTALDGNESGIWGGMTERERHSFKTKVRRNEYATPELLRDLLEVEYPPCERCGTHRREKDDGMCATCVTLTNRENREKERASA
jgi:WhiB family redox-sensing transcriptional regulator